MKKEAEIKYPHSANLFQFCRKVLDYKFGGIRVIDQDVGQILGFDPADCSHWKKGKKNIRSIQAMKAIAEHLGIDEKLVVDVASGDINDLEAFHEYKGYGTFDIDSTVIENAKKDYYRQNASTWTRDKEQEFKDFFDLQEPRINEVVKGIFQKINFNEAPLYLPEIVAAYPNLTLKPTTKDKDNFEVMAHKRDGMTEIEIPDDSKMRPYVRFQIAKAMAGYFFEKVGMDQRRELGDFAKAVVDVQTNLFAAKILTPAHLLRKELANVNVAKDIVSQLAEIFWVSKTFMNRRLREILQSTPEI